MISALHDMRFYKSILIFITALWLGACSTTSGVSKNQTPPTPIVTAPDGAASQSSDGEIIIAQPDIAPEPVAEVRTPPPAAAPPPAAEPAPKIDIPVYQSPLGELGHWSEGDHLPALQAFRRSCKTWETANPQDFLNPHLPDYGRFEDWQDACSLAEIIPDTQFGARQFFENQFAPAQARAQSASSESNSGHEGLITGYYQPEIDVRTIPDGEFFEPILAKPSNKSVQNLPRKDIGPTSSRVIAYGRPLDVFFMQIQGSGHIRFENGRKIRAAYNGNNGKPYRSIGSVLIARGELVKDKSSKQDIENWMVQAGPVKARALMNENPRYIFFVEQAISEGEGPLGAMRVPLTAFGSVAVDPRYHPYGVPYYLVVNLPKRKGDYKGSSSGQLVIAQDTGKAIRGPLRGDLYFGSGTQAGDLAGVMKHKADWSILLPRKLVARQAPIS